jgi:hypothetical protein
MEIQGTSLQAQRHGTGQTEMSGISVVSHRRVKWKRVGKSLQSAMQTIMVKAREWWTAIDNLYQLINQQ